MQVNFSWRHLEPSKAMQDIINTKLAKLEKFSKRISSIDVILTQEGARNEVEFQIRLRKAPTFIVKEQSYDMYVALNSCLSRAKRKVKQYESEVRGRK